MTNHTELLKTAAAEGKFTLAHVEDGDDFDSVEEWLEYAGERDLDDAALAAGLTEESGPDIYEINRKQDRRAASFLGLCPVREKDLF